MAVVGLEPSCVLGFRDEIPALVKSDGARRLASRAMLFEEYVTRELDTGALPRGPIGKRALLHGHCHQKSFGVMGPVEAALRLVPDLAVEMVESSCCGMAGSFGYGADTVDVSLKMAELSLLPAVRKAPADAIIVADGFSCRHQINDGTGREALHVAEVLAMSVESAWRAYSP
jgi:Fe-S oxidoreductase